MTTIVDYSLILSQVTAELTSGITVAAVAIGAMWGAKIGLRFVRALLEDDYYSGGYSQFNYDSGRQEYYDKNGKFEGASPVYPEWAAEKRREKLERMRGG